MTKLMILVLLCCSVGFLQCNDDKWNQKRGYVFTIPYKLPIGGNTTGCISLQNTEPPADIVTELLHENKVISSASHKLTTGSKACLKLNVPMISTRDAVVRLTMKFEKYPQYVVTEERKVEISLNNRLVFVQTDKALYKPGDEVKIRVLQIYQDFTPVWDSIPLIFIKNPSKNKIMEYRRLSTQDGMKEIKFYLTTEAQVGRWEVLAKMYPNIESYSVSHFEVRNEGVSNFEVKIIPPRYILADTVKPTWKICVSYDYDVPAKGTLTTKLTPYAPNLPNPFEEMVKTIELNSPDGCTEILTSGAVFNLDRWSVLPKEMILTANFTESATGITQSKISRTPILYEPIKLKFAPTMDKYFKLDTPYEGKLLVFGPDDSPLPNERIELCIETKGTDHFIRHVHECRNFTSSSAGSVDFIIPPQHRKTTSLTIVAFALNYRTKYYFVDDKWKTFMNQPATQIDLYPLYSMSNSYIVVTREKERLICGEDYTFNVLYTLSEYIEYGDSIVFHYSVNSRSGILLDEQTIHQADIDTILDYSQYDNILGTLKASTNRFYIDPLVHRFKITIKITPNMAPISELLIYYVRRDGEIVSASHTLDVGYCFNNIVKTGWNTTGVQQPGATIKYNVQAASDSVCAISLVEKAPPSLPQLPFNLLNSYQLFESVKKNNPIAMDGIMLQPGCNNTANSKDQPDYFRNRVDIMNDGPNLYVHEMQAFNDFGTIVMTNMKQTTQSCSQSFRSKRSIKVYSHDPVSHTNSLDDISILPSQFPLTWLWDIVPVNNTSNITIEQTLPDKISDWGGHTVCISPKHGLGVAPVKFIETRRPFFFDYDLPSVTKMGEMIVVKARLFNYLDRKIPVTVRMKMDGIDVLQSNLNASFCIEPRNIADYKYFIIPRNLGTFHTTAEVFIDKSFPEICDGSDVPDSRSNITKPLEVVGEGFEAERTSTTLLCAVNASVDVTHTFTVSHPTEIIKETAYATVFLVGNVLGLTPDNLKNLVRMPTGCGEQNIAIVIPNIVVIVFVDTLKIKDVVIRQNAIKNVEQGYQNQLNYRNEDGSYSTFPKSPRNIWLTAFVVKAFAMAQKYIYISETDLQQSADWITEKQMPNGCFPIIGSLAHKDMKGGLQNDDSPAALTVFILISLLESELEVSNSTIDNALSCIERERAHLNSTLYTRVITSYALTLLKHPSANATVEELMDLANHKDDTMWWEDKKNPALSASIEMTSYMILSLVQFGEEKNLTDASKAVRWMLKHRNAGGGFVSTHDTALAFHALAKFAVHGGNKSNDLSILLSADRLDRSYTLKNGSDMIPLHVRLPEIPTTVDMYVEGSGCIVAQAIVKYSILPRPSIFFDLSSTVHSIISGNCDILVQTVCTRYKGADGQSNMAIIEIGMLSGYGPDRNSLELLNKQQKTKRYEIVKNNLNLYFEKLVAAETCVSFKIRRQVPMKNLKPSNLKVYDYYRPEVIAMATYTMNSECNNTVVAGRDTELLVYVPIKDTTGSIFIFHPPKRESGRSESPDTLQTTTTMRPWTSTAAPPNKEGNKTKNTTESETCPVCVDKLPSDITDVYCSAKSVMKVGIRGGHKVVALTDMSPSHNITRLHKMIQFDLSPNCTCSSLNSTGHLGLIINKDKDIISTKDHILPLNGTYYIYVLPKVDYIPCEVADARHSCLNEEKLPCT